MRSPFLSAALLCGVATPALAQEQDGQVWLTTSASVGIGEPLALDFESILRFGDAAGGLYEGEYVAAIEYDLTDRITLTGGYARVVGYSRDGVTRTEDRPRQQIAYGFGRVGPGRLSARLRFEQRFRSDGDDTGHRVRPQVKYALPLDASGDVELGISHESYFNFNDTDWGQATGHERMRNLIAVSFPLVGPVEAELGYLNQYGFAQGAGRDSMDHVASFSIGASF